MARGEAVGWWLRMATLSAGHCAAVSSEAVQCGASAPCQPTQTNGGPPSPPRLLSKILTECEDADEIEYLVDGSWCPIRAEKERSCSPQCPILVLGEYPALRV